LAPCQYFYFPCKISKDYEWTIAKGETAIAVWRMSYLFGGWGVESLGRLAHAKPLGASKVALFFGNGMNVKCDTTSDEPLFAGCIMVIVERQKYINMA
jgi:hypothetical protein